MANLFNDTQVEELRDATIANIDNIGREIAAKAEVMRAVGLTDLADAYLLAGSGLLLTDTYLRTNDKLDSTLLNKLVDILNRNRV